MKSFLYPIFLGLIILGGCTKETQERTTVWDGDYQPDNTLVAGPIMMYTQNGAVNNPGLTDRFLSRRSINPDYFSRTNVPYVTNGTVTVSIRNNKDVVFSTLFAGTNYLEKSEIISQLPTHLVLADLDSATTESHASIHCLALSEQMEAVSPTKRCRPILPAPNNAQWCTFRPVQVLKINADQLSLTRLTWVIQTAQSPGYCLWEPSGSSNFYGSKNLFNSAVVNQLGAGDTIVVQERSIALIKK